MTLKRHQKLCLHGSVFVALPVTLGLLVWRGLHAVKYSWHSFVELCSNTSVYFWEYFIQHANPIIIISILVFAMGLALLTRYLFGQFRRVHLLKKKLSGKSTILERGIYLVQDERPFAMTVGFWHPLIYVSKSLKHLLSDSEMRAVIKHERYHQIKHHPLKLLFASSMQRLFYFLPILREYATYIKLKHELEADAYSVESTSQRDLISALSKTGTVLQEYSKEAYVYGFSMVDRVHVLIDEKKPAFQLSWFLVLFSVVLLVSLNVALLRPSVTHANSNVNLNQAIDHSAGYCDGGNILQSIMSFGQSDLNMTPK